MKPQESPKVESEPAKKLPEGAATKEEEEASSGWGGWASGWMDSSSASSLLGKAMSSVTAAVEVAKSKVGYFILMPMQVPVELSINGINGNDIESSLCGAQF